MLNNFSPFPVLQTERLVLRQLTMQDEKEIFLLRSDENVNKYIDRPPAVSLEDAQKFIEKINRGIAGNESLFWAIHFKNDAQLIGTICCWNFCKEEERAEIGYELLPFFQGKGIMQEAVSAVIQFGFQTMQLQSVEAWLKPQNLRSVNVLERNEFKRNIEAEKRLSEVEKADGIVAYCLNKSDFAY